MANVSFVGTVKSYVFPDIESLTTAYVTIKENDVSIHVDIKILERKQLTLKKGKAYLFTGDIYCGNPSFLVHEIMDKPLNAISGKLTKLSRNYDYTLAISGKIIEVRCQPTRKGKTMVYAKIEGVDIPCIFFFPDIVEGCLSAYETKENITIIGELQIQTPEFTVENVEQLSK